MRRSISAAVTRLAIRGAGFTLHLRLSTGLGALRYSSGTRCLTLRIMPIARGIRLSVLVERGHLKLAQLFPGPVQMLVFFLFNGLRRRRQDLTKTIVGGLPGDLAEQFPVGMILRFREHYVLHRVQLILIARESRIAHGAQQRFGLLARDLSGMTLRARDSAELV